MIKVAVATAALLVLGCRLDPPARTGLGAVTCSQWNAAASAQQQVWSTQLLVRLDARDRSTVFAVMFTAGLHETCETAPDSRVLDDARAIAATDPADFPRPRVVR